MLRVKRGRRTEKQASGLGKGGRGEKNAGADDAATADGATDDDATANDDAITNDDAATAADDDAVTDDDATTARAIGYCHTISTSSDYSREKVGGGRTPLGYQPC